MPRKRCPNGTRKNKKTGKCEAKIERTQRKKSTVKKSASKGSANFRRKSYVMIYGVGTLAHERNRVGQVIDVSRNGEKYAILLNYNGFLSYVNKTNMRLATDIEKKNDKKNHNKSDILTGPERLVLNSEEPRDIWATRRT